MKVEGDLPYHIVLTPDTDPDSGKTGWVAEVEELPGCLSQGITADEAVDRVRDAMEGWLSVAREEGFPIPSPRQDDMPSGRLLIRMPKGLHAALAREARIQGVSINQLVVSLLSGSLKWRAVA